MASFIGSDQELLCPICVCCYNTPRRLTGCVHSFCERCIVTLIQNLKGDDKLGEEFECPVCRLPSKSPETDTITTSKWVQTLDIDKELGSKVERQNEQDSKWCSQCRFVDKFIKSKVYCLTCQFSFCGKCSETLHSFMMHRDHAIIDIKVDGENEAINEKAVQLLQTILTCSNHPDKSIEFFCQDDKAFCCVNCVTNEHQVCINIASLKEPMGEDCDDDENADDEADDNADDDENDDDNDDDDDDDKLDENGSAHLLDSLSKLNNHIKSIVTLIKEKDAETKKAPEKLAVEFHDIKKKIIRLLDFAEEQITYDSKALSKEISIKSIDEIELLNAISSEIDVVTYLLGTLVPKLPRDSAMVCCKNAEVILQNLERKVLERGSSFETEELQLDIEKEFDKIINLGPNETENIVSINRNQKCYPLPRLNDKFLLREGKVKLVGEKTNCISEISPGIKSRYNCITFLPNDNLILTDTYYGVCLLVDANGEPMDSFDFSGHKSGIDQNFIYASCLANGHIAVSIKNEQKICFLSADGNELEKKGEVVCKYTPTAVHGLRNGDLIVLWDGPQSVGIITFYCGSYIERKYFKSDSKGNAIRHRNRLAVDEDRHHVVLSWKGINTAAVSCYDFDGNKIFEHANIKDPRGMALDGDGNIYVCESQLGRICVLSPEGLMVRIIQEGCPKYPLGIGFSKTGNTFAVTQRKPDFTKVMFFSIEQL